MLPVSLFLATISLAGADVGADWPLKSGYGGIIGDITLDSVVAWKELQQFINREAFCFFAGFFCFCALYSAVGFSIKEWGRLGSIVFWFTGCNRLPNTKNNPMKFKLGKWTKQKTKKSISKAGFRREPKLRRQNSTENKTGSKIPIHFKGEPFSKQRNSRGKKRKTTSRQKSSSISPTFFRSGLSRSIFFARHDLIGRCYFLP